MKTVRWRALAILAVAALPASLLTSCGPAPTRLYGTHDDLTYDVDNSRIASTLDFEDAFDVQLSRNTLRWNTVQPSSALTYDWSKTDFVVNQAQQRGIKVQFIVRDAPQWANGSTDPRVVPSNQTALNTFVNRYKNFFKAAVQRYGDRVKQWEVWSEPNEHHYFQPLGLNPQPHKARWMDIYAQIYKATAATAAQTNSSVKVAIGAITGIGASCCILGTEFVSGMISRNVAFKFLAVNPHSSQNQAPWECIQFRQSFCDIQKIRNLLVNANRSTVGLWISEFGWQVGGFTRSGTTTTRLRIPGDPTKLKLWPNSGQVVVGPDTLNYQSITRGASYSDINLAAPMTSVPPSFTPVWSRQAEQKQATYLRAALQMVKGTYHPAAGRPQQNYSYVQTVLYYRNRDKTSVNWGMYGLFHTPVPTFDESQPWYLHPKPAAGVFKDEVP